MYPAVSLFKVIKIDYNIHKVSKDTRSYYYGDEEENIHIMIVYKNTYSTLRILGYGLMLIALVLRSIYQLEESLFIGFSLILLFIANSQLRQFCFVKFNRIQKIGFCVSVIVEIILATLLVFYLDMSPFLVIYMLVLDIGCYTKKMISIPILSAISINTIVLQVMREGWMNESLILNALGIITFALLAVYMKEEENKKVEAQELYDQLRISEKKLTEAYKELAMYANTVEELTLLRERTRVSRELHDSVGHALSALYIQLKAIKTLIKKVPEQAEQMLEMNIEYTHKTLEDVRETVRQLKPREFEGLEGIFTIEEMVNNYKKMTGVDIRFILSKEKGMMTSDQSHHLYRIIQEALSNAVRHGKAKYIQISIQFHKKELYVYIKDDGIGCKDYKPSFGMRGIQERIEALHGSLTVQTGEGKGFELTMTIPRFEKTVNDKVI